MVHGEWDLWIALIAKSKGQKHIGQKHMGGAYAKHLESDLHAHHYGPCS